MARKTAIALTLLIAASVSLTACGRKGQLDSPSTAAEKAATPTPTPTPAPPPTKAP